MKKRIQKQFSETASIEKSLVAASARNHWGVGGSGPPNIFIDVPGPNFGQPNLGGRF